jgi:hypothetical protein
MLMQAIHTVALNCIYSEMMLVCKVGKQRGKYTSPASKKEEEERYSKLLQLAELEDGISRDEATACALVTRTSQYSTSRKV